MAVINAYNAYYEKYIKDIFKLSKSVVLKTNAFINDTNRYLKSLGYEVSDDPYTWKSYLNLSGQLHAFDSSIYVKSLDTSANIEFKRSVLNNHPITKSRYSYGSELYNELISLYPSHKYYIFGTVVGLDITECISKPNNSILFYDKRYVESNETNLIFLLQKYIDAYYRNYYNESFEFYEDLYALDNLARVYAFMPSKIINIRLNNAKTDYAHSYHIRKHLSSFGGLDAEYEFLTNKQRLWLYRNIRSIRNNIGKQSTYAKLHTKILTDRNFPLDRQVLIFKDHNILEDLTGLVRFKKESVNGIVNTMTDVERTVDEIYRMENSLAPGNETYMDEGIKQTTTKVEVSTDTRHITKILESSIFTQTDLKPYDYTSVAIDTWFYMANIGMYTGYIDINLPGSEVEVTYHIQDAVWVFIYTYLRSKGIDLEKIPAFMVFGVPRTPIPSYQELLTFLNNPDIVVKALEVSTEPVMLNDVLAFGDFCKRLSISKLIHKNIEGLRLDLHEHACTRSMVQRFYVDKEILLREGTSYDDYLESLGFNKESFDQDQCALIAYSILEKATGISVQDTSNIKLIHQSMVNIMRKLSSFNVQYIDFTDELISSDYDWQYLRYTDTLNSEETDPDSSTINIVPIETIKIDAEEDHVSKDIMIAAAMSEGYGVIDCATGHEIVPWMEPVLMENIMEYFIPVNIEMVDPYVDPVNVNTYQNEIGTMPNLSTPTLASLYQSTNLGVL